MLVTLLYAAAAIGLHPRGDTFTDFVVVRFGPAVQRGQHVHADAAEIEFIQMSAAARRQIGGQLLTGEPDFLAGIKIEVVGFDVNPLPGPTGRGFE